MTRVRAMTHSLLSMLNWKMRLNRKYFSNFKSSKIHMEVNLTIIRASHQNNKLSINQQMGKASKMILRKVTPTATVNVVLTNSH